MKHVFRWCDHLNKQTSFFSILEKHWIFLVNKNVELLKYLNWYKALLHNFYYLHHLPIHLFKMAWSDQEFFIFIIFILFFKTCQTLWLLKNILFWSFILSDTCPRITLKWYKAILNQVERTGKMIKKTLTITYHRTLKWITLVNEIMWVNNYLPETRCLRHAKYHMLLFFILQSLHQGNTSKGIQKQVVIHV